LLFGFVIDLKVIIYHGVIGVSIFNI